MGIGEAWGQVWVWAEDGARYGYGRRMGPGRDLGGDLFVHPAGALLEAPETAAQDAHDVLPGRLALHTREGV